MSKTSKKNTLHPFIDFVPAELKEYKTWVIVYRAIDPFEQNPDLRLKRKMNRVKPMSSKTERRKYAKRICLNINKKLEKGWTPFVDEKNTKSFTTLFNAFDIYLNEIKHRVKKEDLSKDTLRAYTSLTSNLKIILTDSHQENIFVNKWTEELFREILEIVYFDRDNTAVTHNNYFSFMGTFTRWLIKKSYIATDFSKKIDKITVTEKTRTVIPQKDLKIIFNYFKTNDMQYFILCYTAYYSLIRRTELTLLKVSDVYFYNGMINVRAKVSKNNKDQMVTIPNELMPYLTSHLKRAKNDEYLFSADKCATGNLRMDPKRISEKWSKMRKALKMPKEYQWYSLKDTGITNFLHLGIPTIDVKNQARHHSISQTEKYIPKKIIKAVSNIQKAKFKI